MNKIDVHADDYGITMNTSKEMMEGINAGKLRSISIMPNMSCFEEAAKYYFSNLEEGKSPLLSVHLNFMEGYCLSKKQEVRDLVDEKGLFTLSWIQLVKYNYSLRKRAILKEQLKKEIKAQIEKVDNAYHLFEKGKLRIDSHQHTHMIPLVMEAAIEVIKENNYPVEYIRLSKEPWSVYLKQVRLLTTYRPVNLVKVMILNYFSHKDERLLKAVGLKPMLLSGVMLSGKMDASRLKTLIPGLKACAERKALPLEILFHPGTGLKEEMGEEFNHFDANEFYLSPNRKIEYESMMELKL